MGCNTFRIHNAFNNTLISTSEPENIQAILATEFHEFNLGPVRRDSFFEVLGNGIFTAEGEAWAHYRAQLKPQFTRDQVRDLESANRHLQILFRAFPEENGLRWIEEADLMPLLYRFIMDVRTEFLFGQSVNSQSTALYSLDSGNTKDVKEEVAFANAINFAQEYIAWRVSLRSLYWLASSKKFRKACQTIHEFADRFVRIALDPNNKRRVVASSKKEKYVLLDELVAETRDPTELRDQILHVLLAGRDTTSATLCWTLLLLSRHKDEFQKLRDAVISHFGIEIAPTNEMTFASLKACKAITHILYETLRLYPLAPINGRRALKDTVLPTGGGPDRKQPIAVRKGEQIRYSMYVMHRRHDIWGDDADEFRPDRWEKRKLGWEFIPFSGGPRVCLGRKSAQVYVNEFTLIPDTEQYALNEASFVIAKFLQD